MTRSYNKYDDQNFPRKIFAAGLRCVRIVKENYRKFAVLGFYGALASTSPCLAEQSLLSPLHYPDDFAFYKDVFTTPSGRRRLDESYQSPVSFSVFHLTGYDDSLLFKRHKLMLVNDSSQGGSIALVACILNGDEAIEFSRRLALSDALDDDEMHPNGFANLRISGIISMYNDGPSQQPRAVLAIEPCHVGSSFKDRRLDSYSKIRAPIRRWSQSYDGIIPNFNAALPYY